MNSILASGLVPNRLQEAPLLLAKSIGVPPMPAVREPATLRVLVVDDCPVQRLMATALLAKWGILPEFASDGVEGALLANEQHFDLILMDIHMGVLGGVDATKRIRQNERRRGGPEVPIVAYTAEPLGDGQPSWAAAGISAALAKPCQPAEMAECLQKWCGVNVNPLQH